MTTFLLDLSAVTDAELRAIEIPVRAACARNSAFASTHVALGAEAALRAAGRDGAFRTYAVTIERLPDADPAIAEHELAVAILFTQDRRDDLALPDRVRDVWATLLGALVDERDSRARSDGQLERLWTRPAVGMAEQER